MAILFCDCTTSNGRLAREAFAEMLQVAISLAYPGVEIDRERLVSTISISKPSHGDLSSSVAFVLSKPLKIPPRDIAVRVAGLAKPTGHVFGMEQEGGYINAKLDRAAYSKVVMAQVLLEGENYGRNQLGSNKRVIVEFPSVNPSKPWHIGHLRNAILGDSIANIMAACGYHIERDDYIEDLGLQIAESVWGYRNIGNRPDKKYDQWLGEQYVKVNKIMKEKDISGEINEILKRMEDLSTEESALARTVSEHCVDAQYETAFGYGISHDLRIWESDIVRAKLLEKAMRLGMDNGVLERAESGKYANCIVVSLDKVAGGEDSLKDLAEDVKVLIRSNGTATYVAKDVAFHMWKFGIVPVEFMYKKLPILQSGNHTLYTTAENGERADFGRADIVVNVIGSAQRHPQLILRSILGAMGYKKQADRIVHVAYGEVGLSEGSLSGRSGGWLGEGRSFTADTLLDEAKKKVAERVKENTKAQKQEVDEKAIAAIAVGAIKFEFLRIAPEKSLVFAWDKALDFGGNSGPYCMYMYTRARRIVEKAEFDKGDALDAAKSGVMGDVEFELIKLLSAAEDVFEKACVEYRPNVITDYLLDVSSTFSKFYEKVPVLAGGEQRDARLALVFSTMQVINNALLLLGINTVERM